MIALLVNLTLSTAQKETLEHSILYSEQNIPFTHSLVEIETEFSVFVIVKPFVNNLNSYTLAK